MSDGHSCQAWNHTAELLCLLANCNRDPKKKRHPWHPFDFHPYAKRYGWRKPAPPKTKDLSILKVLFVDQRVP